jgi:hypothetical protein
MNFQISGLHERHFQHLFGQTSEVLAKHGVERITVDSRPGYPCRVSLKDVNIGETVLLMNYKHLPALSPYRSSHAIFVMEGAKGAIFGKNHIPEMLRNRLLSVRAFDANEMMVDADVVDGLDLEPIIERMFSIELVDFLHIHNAKRGCFMARAVSGRSISQKKGPRKRGPFLYKPKLLDEYDILCLRTLLALRDGEFDLLAFNE